MRKFFAIVTLGMLMGTCDPGVAWQRCETEMYGPWQSQGMECLAYYSCARYECGPWYTPFLADLLFVCATDLELVGSALIFIGEDPVEWLPLFVEVE